MRHIPWYFSFYFIFSPIIGVAMKSCFSNGVSTEKVYLWNLTYYFVFLPNIIVWCSWWYDMSGQCLCRVKFGLCCYWEALALYLIGRYSQREYQMIWSVFKIKYYSMLPWGYNVFQQQENIYMSCKYARRKRGQMKFWSSWLWWRLIWISRTIIFQKVFFHVLILWLKYIVLFYFLVLMDVLTILFWTIPGRDVVN